ncbi:uncharacterized protein BP01DRAFT_387587 [Aspergillus saccharolyticus JOP 1030-1]|uniref:Apiosidase-like catalytic domain-containing protein n=1 Tax=Aspergillus saccharolyticus JOP 1030-1 TaxID=1450539 RepID=A0A318YYW0_9EURO|nr:hypothetical protein BP01DRAFT_387587 [Aspergillus saccharolyticus JOP 1030-1]PYH40155.1 hypothetical protein BP01DRAFT_387587 [Aspergillus saccharolyticus JOP 1030-1]
MRSSSVDNRKFCHFIAVVPLRCDEAKLKQHTPHYAQDYPHKFRSSGCWCPQNIPSPRLRTAGRYLQQSNGEPFFWQADTAWLLFHRLNYSAAETYLSDRARRRFTVGLLAVGFTQEGIVTGERQALPSAPRGQRRTGSNPS